MMTKGRRLFTDEFKQEAVALLESSGRPLERIAKELDIQPSVLRNWRRRGRPGGAAAPHTAGGGPPGLRRPSRGDCPLEARTGTRLHGTRHSKKTVSIFSEPLK